MCHNLLVISRFKICNANYNTVKVAYQIKIHISLNWYGKKLYTFLNMDLN